MSDLNQQPADYKSAALPIAPTKQIKLDSISYVRLKVWCLKIAVAVYKVVGMVRIELTWCLRPKRSGSPLAHIPIKLGGKFKLSLDPKSNVLNNLKFAVAA